MNTNDLLKQINTIELELIKVFGGQILNYISVFNPSSNIKITFPELTTQSSALLTKYITTVTKLFSSINYPFKFTTVSLSEQFLEISAELYFSRFVQAKLLFAEYGLVRIATPAERKMRKVLNVTELDESISIQKDSLLYSDEYNNFDIPKTISHEIKSSQIALTLTVAGQIARISKVLLYDLKRITLKGMAPDIFENELLALGEELAEYMLSIFGTQVYEYINRGIPLQEAKENLVAYYTRQIQPPARQFPPSLAKIEENVQKILQQSFISNKDMTSNTKETLYQDYIELVLLYMRMGTFIPKSYYKVAIRKSNPEKEYELNYAGIIDTLSINPNGTTSSYVIETYGVDFTPASKILIFTAVTNELQNPLFTLEDYLEIDG